MSRAPELSGVPRHSTTRVGERVKGRKSQRDTCGDAAVI
jgi:hypothetical protein